MQTNKETNINTQQDSNNKKNYFDAIVIGAGISGVGCAHYLKEFFPNKSFIILEKMEDIGGTWLIHKYPGARSDSDLFTFGYEFKPWSGDPIASRSKILDYMKGSLEQDGLTDNLRLGHEVKEIAWSSDRNEWTITCEVDGQTQTFITPFVWACPGYYRHEQGYTPDWEGFENFQGQVVHPQTWPEDLDYKDKKIVVIGSGATAATLLPSLANDAAHITMLQRSPTYFFADRNGSDFLDELRSLDVDPAWIHEIMRAKSTRYQETSLQRVKQDPKRAKEGLINAVKERLDDFPVDPHFTPNYDPWTQRVAFVPDGGGGR